jgi:hypothetical protein
MSVTCPTESSLWTSAPALSKTLVPELTHMVRQYARSGGIVKCTGMGPGQQWDWNNEPSVDEVLWVFDNQGHYQAR